ncbi:hypothetical protein JDV02_006271 [Purpureocillium takamizusanense]|uniref:NmrA-like domain-containing protein n=1 Tax=Purpureocillium takamizusanense TaxID=2060973 RepID=A0A9Q8QHW7_9HYPO|nr:uncharacterized protein JDV02_006271 [Purpureocillium takamizusanense]UNI20153.1 hypothetical protein JDV02_006271 [Purpureocillium takamizusanense]
MTDPKSRTIAVLGATGNQGGGVVRALLTRHPDLFTIRAITRDPNSPAAQRLLHEHEGSGRLTLVQGDVYDVQSLRLAFKEAHGVFAVTNHRSPEGAINSEEDLRHEVQSGRNIIDAAKYCNVQHFVISSLPNIKEASHGQFGKVYHFDHKDEIEVMARSQLPAVTALLPDDGTVRFCAAIPGNVQSEWVDPGYDIGVYASEVFAKGPDLTRSKRYPVLGQKMAFADFADIFTKMTSQLAYFDPISVEEWGDTVTTQVGPGFNEDIKEMIEWIAVAPVDKICYGTMDPSEDLSREDLGLEASTFEDWMRRSQWEGPPKVVR